MSFLRREIRALRREAKTLREMGFENFAKEKEHEANMYENIEDKIKNEEAVKSNEN